MKAEVTKIFAKIPIKDQKKMTFADVLGKTIEVGSKIIDHNTSITLRKCMVDKCNNEVISSLKKRLEIYDGLCKDKKNKNAKVYCDKSKTGNKLLVKKPLSLENYTKISKVFIGKSNK